MSSLTDNNNIEVSVPRVEFYEKITHYKIVVQLGSYLWTTVHRYSEFADLHELLVTYHGLARDLLPPKKIIGNKDPIFIEKRRKDLELYLQTVVSFMSAALPEQLAEFLDLKHYEINFLLQDMANFYYKEGDLLLQQNEFSIFNPLQLMAISKQMQSPHPVLFAHEKENDFANIIDFCSNVKKITILGSSDPYKSSNLIMNNLRYNLNVFKNVQEVNIYEASIGQIDDLGPLRKSIKRLIVHKSELESLSKLLVCDSLHQEINEGDKENIWAELEFLDISYNDIECIDKSVILTPHLKYFYLKANKLTSVGPFLTKLPKLVHLDISNNRLQELSDLHTKLGNVKKIDLSQNCLTNLEGLAKLYSVVFLNLASNNIVKESQVEAICHLPCLEELNLTGNPIATIIDYRTKIMELFGKRACEVCLDNERPTQKELDKVAVMLALKHAREGRLPTLTLSHPIPPTSLNLLLERPDVGTIAKE